MIIKGADPKTYGAVVHSPFLLKNYVVVEQNSSYYTQVYNPRLWNPQSLEWQENFKDYNPSDDFKKFFVKSVVIKANKARKDKTSITITQPASPVSYVGNGPVGLRERFSWSGQDKKGFVLLNGNGVSTYTNSYEYLYPTDINYDTKSLETFENLMQYGRTFSDYPILYEGDIFDQVVYGDVGNIYPRLVESKQTPPMASNELDEYRNYSALINAMMTTQMLQILIDSTLNPGAWFEKGADGRMNPKQGLSKYTQAAMIWQMVQLFIERGTREIGLAKSNKGLPWFGVQEYESHVPRPSPENDYIFSKTVSFATSRNGLDTEYTNMFNKNGPTFAVSKNKKANSDDNVVELHVNKCYNSFIEFQTDLTQMLYALDTPFARDKSWLMNVVNQYQYFVNGNMLVETDYNKWFFHVLNSTLN